MDDKSVQSLTDRQSQIFEKKHGFLAGKKLNLIAISFFILLFISIIPIIWVSFYSHPIADDFGFSKQVNHIINNGGGIFDVFSASFQQVKETYFGWQGTYASVFIFSIQPAAFSENLYFLTTIVMLTALITSTLFFINTIFKVCGLNCKVGLIVSCVILLLSIHFVPDKNEAFFWWNGSSYYTLFYSFSLLFFAVVIRLYYTKSLVRRIALFIFSILLSVVIGGGNYSTALLTSVILILVTCILFFKKRKLWHYYVIVLFVLLISFSISMIAPGNKVRASAVSGMSPIRSILFSLYYAFEFLAKWTGLAQISGFIIIAIISLVLTKKLRFQFKYPFIIFVVTFLIFATQLTPPLYAMSSVGAGRQVNIYYYSYLLLVSFNLFYFCGWIIKKQILNVNTIQIHKGSMICVSIMLICLFFAGCLNYGITNTTFVDTFSSLKKNLPQTYSAEYNGIIAEIKNGNTAVSDLNTVPDYFSSLGITEDPDFWINKQLARYYEVDEIKLISE